VKENRPQDIRIYLTDHRRVTATLGWKPRRNIAAICADTFRWIEQQAEQVKTWA
jgi:UDP-glucose 4-epimerase